MSTARSRMADGRLFTDYRPNCQALPQQTAGMSGLNYRTILQQNGVEIIEQDRSKALEAAQFRTRPLVDTMVPELNKRVYDWRHGAEFLSQRAGVGTGRMYLPGRADLITADPDEVARATIPATMLPGSFATGPVKYTAVPVRSVGSVSRPNRYSMPYM